ncbi:MAG TPA: transcriptional regulator GutM [Proteiniclasticum sp.]|nr:transcriptional regulator GutM [Proteiniclasticum sp.]
MEMKYMIIIGAFVMAAFALQYYLGFKQITHFGEEYSRMRREGKVAIGRRPGKVTSGTLVLFSLDKEDRISYGRKLQGTTVFAKFNDFNTFNGRKIGEIKKTDPEMKKEIRITRRAVLNAVENFLMVRAGKIIPDKKSPFGNITGVFKKAKV